MSSSLLIYLIAIIFLLIGAIIIKVYLEVSIKNKIRDYQRQIAQSHARILKLELENEKLERKIVSLEGVSIVDTKFVYS